MFGLAPVSNLACKNNYLATKLPAVVNATEVNAQGELDSPPMFNESPQNPSGLVKPDRHLKLEH
jgi:hypothetical protein